jgi:hypothetical protein
MQARNTCMQSLMHVTDSMRSAIGYIAAGFAVKRSMPCACANTFTDYFMRCRHDHPAMLRFNACLYA